MIEKAVFDRISYLSHNKIKEKLSQIKNLYFSNWEEFLDNPQKVLIGVNDATRITPTEKILDFLVPLLTKKGMEIYYIIATGAHKEPSNAEFRYILGKYYVDKAKIITHDARRSEFAYLGTTSRGTNILVNKQLLNFDKIIYIGSIEPHYFAGFTGGRKFLLPGISHYDSITHNHFFACDEKSQVAVLNGNPVHEDMMEFAKVVVNSGKTRDFVFIHTVVSNGKIIDLEVGDVEQSFYNMTLVSKKALSIRTRLEKYDVVIGEVPDFAGDLYQGLKAFENHKNLLKKSGFLLIKGNCPNGIGPENYYRKLLGVTKITRDYINKLRKDYHLGDHKAINILNFLSDGRRKIVLITPNKELLLKIENTPLLGFHNFDEFMKFFGLKKGNLSIVSIPEATNTISNLGE